jgi:ATPase subunit of ABC transporter with duplicated ATPase domains
MILWGLDADVPSAPLLAVDRIRKVYRTGFIKRQNVFQFHADFAIDAPTIVGVMGPNGSGKTTLLELIAGETHPTSGSILCSGRNIHTIKYNQRRNLAIHHFGPGQARRFKSGLPNFLLKPSGNSIRPIHLYDEFETEDGFFSFLINHFVHLHRAGHIVFLCLHPSKPMHLEVLRKICGQFLFIHQGAAKQMKDFKTLVEDDHAQRYLGDLLRGIC